MLQPNDPVRLTAGAADDFASASRFVSTHERGSVNIHKRPVLRGPEADRPQHIVRVLARPGLSQGQSGHDVLWLGKIRNYSDNPAFGQPLYVDNPEEDVFIAPLLDQVLQLSSEGLGILVGEHDGLSVYTIIDHKAESPPNGQVQVNQCCDLTRLCVRLEDDDGLVSYFSLVSTCGTTPTPDTARWTVQHDPGSLDTATDRLGFDVLSNILGFNVEPLGAYWGYGEVGSSAAAGGVCAAAALTRVGDPASSVLPSWTLKFRLAGYYRHPPSLGSYFLGHGPIPITWRITINYQKTIQWGGFPIDFDILQPQLPAQTILEPILPFSVDGSLALPTFIKYPRLRVRITAGECNAAFSHRCFARFNGLFPPFNQQYACVKYPSDMFYDLATLPYANYMWPQPPGAYLSYWPDPHVIIGQTGHPTNIACQVGCPQQTGIGPICPPGQTWNGVVCVSPPPPPPPTCPSGQFWTGSACQPTCPDGQGWNGAACVPLNYVCVDGSCFLSVFGDYATLELCNKSCAQLRHTCSKGLCIADTNGEYASQAACMDGQTGAVVGGIQFQSLLPCAGGLEPQLARPRHGMCVNLATVVLRAAGCNAGPRCTWSCGSLNPAVRDHQGISNEDPLLVIPARDCDSECPGWQLSGDSSEPV